MQTTLPGGPEGFIYVPLGSSLFTSQSMLVSEYSAGNVASYTIDANGNPILASRQDFITGLTGAEGAAIDPLTGDFFFSTFGGGSQVIEVQGFVAPTTPSVPEPSTWSLMAAGLAGLGWWRLRRRAAARRDS